MKAKMVGYGVVLCLLLAATGWAQEKADAAYFEGMVKEMPVKKPGKLIAGDGPDLEFTWEKGSWKTPYRQIKTIYLSLTRQSALGELFGLTGAAVGAMKKRKLMLSLILTDDEGKSRRCVFFLPYAATPKFFSVIEEKSGRKVVYESEEARLAVEQSVEKSPGDKSKP